MTGNDNRFAPQKTKSRGGNLPLIFIASAFLCVTVVLAWLQPGLDRNEAARSAETALADPVVIAQPRPETDVPEVNVTRTRTPLLSQVTVPSAIEYRTMSAMITDKLRQPVRLTGQAESARTLPELTGQVLAAFTTDASQSVSPELKNLIVESINQQQSDAYVDVLLNTAAARGRFDIPQALRTASGSLDTRVLLSALAQVAGGQPSLTRTPVALSGTHTVSDSDSLAGIAMAYEGQPLAYVRLLQLNPGLNPRKPSLRVGQSLRLTESN